RCRARCSIAWMTVRAGLVVALVSGAAACGGMSTRPDGGHDASGRAGTTGRGGSGAGTGFAGTGAAARGGAGGTGVAGAGTGGGGGGAGTAGGGECTPRLLMAGSQILIAFFVVDEGVITVLSDQVALVGRNAQVIKSVPFPREIKAAAFDGTTLVIADL